MTLYEEIVLHHYKFHTKNQNPDVSLRIATRQAYEAMQEFRDYEQMQAWDNYQYQKEQKKEDRKEMEVRALAMPDYAEVIRKDFDLQWKHLESKPPCGCSSDNWSWDCIPGYDGSYWKEWEVIEKTVNINRKYG